MKEYQISYRGEFCLTVIAENEDEAFKLAQRGEVESVNPMGELHLDYLETIETKDLCPHDNTPLETKMVDVDGTNLVESMVCPLCSYGLPALS